MIDAGEHNYRHSFLKSNNICKLTIHTERNRVVVSLLRLFSTTTLYKNCRQWHQNWARFFAPCSLYVLRAKLAVTVTWCDWHHSQAKGPTAALLKLSYGLCVRLRQLPGTDRHQNVYWLNITGCRPTSEALAQQIFGFLCYEEIITCCRQRWIFRRFCID